MMKKKKISFESWSGGVLTAYTLLSSIVRTSGLINYTFAIITDIIVMEKNFNRT